MRLEPNKFLTELNRLYDAVKESKKGTVFLTMKTTNGKSARGKEKGRGEYFCLVRATDGKRRKISTVVPKTSLAQFKDSFGTILRAKMDGLKKRERKREKKAGDGKTG
jgi:signal recognition particle subunit SRP14